MQTAILFRTCRNRRVVTWCASLSVLAVPFLLLTPSGATDPPAKTKSVFCPVVGTPECKSCERCPSGYCALQPDAQISLVFDGGKVQFCCGKCKAIFEKSPAKFAPNAHHQLAATGQARQQKCPLCGSEVGRIPPLSIGGVSVGFCTDECRNKAVKATPTERMEMLFGEKAFARGFTVVAVNK
jgi:YHS domain-containing protein